VEIGFMDDSFHFLSVVSVIEWYMFICRILHSEKEDSN